MVKATVEVITHCPRPKCGKPIYLDHSNPWCIECGETLPVHVQEQIPQLRKFRSRASAARSSQTESLFLEPDEREVASLGRGYFAHILLGQGLFRDSMIASNRRIYYSGSMMGPIGGRALGKVFGNVIIPLQEVSSLSVVTSQNPGCLAVAMLCSLGVLGGILGFVLGFGDRDGWLAWLGISGSLALVSWVIYQATRRRHFLIASNSITVGIDYQMYGLDAIHDFLRKLGPYLPVPDVIYATEEARGGLNRLHVEAPLAQRGRNKEKEVNEQPAQIEHLVTCKAEDGPTPSRTLPVDDEFKVVTGVVRRKKARHDGPEEGGS